MNVGSTSSMYILLFLHILCSPLSFSDAPCYFVLKHQKQYTHEPLGSDSTVNSSPSLGTYTHPPSHKNVSICHRSRFRNVGHTFLVGSPGTPTSRHWVHPLPSRSSSTSVSISLYPTQYVPERKIIFTLTPGTSQNSCPHCTKLNVKISE